ncbi:MAG: DUF1501 domain-containing protein [Planctomycetes bacterium]|nr:DUF1501 domain-containing protein [Planctomycetota bacterium]
MANLQAAVESPKAMSVIYLWMAGGVTHIDSFDPKPDAPSEIRGVLGDIATNVPGIRFCETLPKLAKAADRLAVVRNFSHDSNDHLLSQVYTLSGRKVDRTKLFTEPNIGSVISHLHGPRNGLPAYIAVPGVTRPGPPPHNFFVGGWLGSSHAPYCLGGNPAEPDFTVGEKLDDPPALASENLTPRSVSLPSAGHRSRLSRRARLRDVLDGALRRLESLDPVAALEAQHQNALRLLQTPSIREAFSIDDEPHAVREAYGRTKIGGRCLMARRLVEAGARFVMVDYGYDPAYGNVWDNHNAPSQNHPPIQEMCLRGYHLAGMDRAFAALIGDLEQRGLLNSTLVVFLTEFGRTPRINDRGGRDHWGAAGSLFFTGAGVRGGQLIGATDDHAGEPAAHGYSPADVAATLYAALGVDHRAFVHDILDRPRPILEGGQPIREGNRNYPARRDNGEGAVPPLPYSLTRFFGWTCPGAEVSADYAAVGRDGVL